MCVPPQRTPMRLSARPFLALSGSLRSIPSLKVISDTALNGEAPTTASAKPRPSPYHAPATASAKPLPQPLPSPDRSLCQAPTTVSAKPLPQPLPSPYEAPTKPLPRPLPQPLPQPLPSTYKASTKPMARPLWCIVFGGGPPCASNFQRVLRGSTSTKWVNSPQNRRHNELRPVADTGRVCPGEHTILTLPLPPFTSLCPPCVPLIIYCSLWDLSPPPSLLQSFLYYCIAPCGAERLEDGGAIWLLDCAAVGHGAAGPYSVPSPVPPSKRHACRCARTGGAVHSFDSHGFFSSRPEVRVPGNGGVKPPYPLPASCTQAQRPPILIAFTCCLQGPQLALEGRLQGRPANGCKTSWQRLGQWLGS